MEDKQDGAAHRELCDTCRGRGWVIEGGRRRDCPSALCEGGWADARAQAAARAAAAVAGDVEAVDRALLAERFAAAVVGAEVDYWSHLAVARGVLARYGRELPEGASTVPAPDWLMWAVLLHRSLAGLVESIDGLGGSAPRRPPWVTP